MELRTLLEQHNLFEKTVECNRNDFLKVGGTIDSQVYYIESGSFKVYVLNESEEQIIRLGYEGDIIVALDSFLNEKPSEFYIQAIKKSLVRVISKEKFYAFVYQNEQNMRWWISMLENLTLQQIEREKDILTSSPKVRYLRVLKRSPHLFQFIPNRHIANYLRMSPETLSRLKNLDLNQEK
jgi:CRP/FNR family transcriptional regulator, anaerobic regulatory protein